MIHSIQASGFQAIPYLETSKLMETYKGTLRLSSTRPNILVGPNGTGKSALLNALSLYTLSYYTGQSTLDHHYMSSVEARNFWNGKEFLPGLSVAHPDQPHPPFTLYYRPYHIPGNEPSVTHCLFTGYSDEAHAFIGKTRHKSSGESARALMKRILAVLNQTEVLSQKYAFCNWNGESMALSQKEEDSLKYYHSYSTYVDSDIQRRALRQRYISKDPIHHPITNSLLLLDEPEQSLDLRGEFDFWKTILQFSPSKFKHPPQILIATHSFLPFLYPLSCNLIETVPGYIRETQEMLKTVTQQPIR